MTAAIDDYINLYFDFLFAYLSDWDSIQWQCRAECYSCTRHSHSTKTDISLRILHFTCYSFIYEQISSCDCSIFSHNISLSKILSQAIYRTWWTDIDPICPTVSCFQYSCLFRLHWHSSTPFQPGYWPPCWQDQSRIIGWGTHDQVIWAVRGLDPIVWPNFGFIVFHAVHFAVVWVIQMTFPGKAIFDVRNAFRCTIIVTLKLMMIDCFNSADMHYFSSSSRLVLCRYSWWQRWSFWKFDCSRAIMSEVWPGFFDDFFNIGNVSYGGHLLDSSAGFYLCST